MVSVGERFGLVRDPQFMVEEVPEGLRIARVSAFTNNFNAMTLPITMTSFVRWRQGRALIQEEFGQLSPEQREFLMTGCTPEEWADVFADSEEEDPV
jgi:hypothetical protein